jgi:hypothetical protein
MVEVGQMRSGKPSTWTAPSPGNPQLSKTTSANSNSRLPLEWREALL